MCIYTHFLYYVVLQAVKLPLPSLEFRSRMTQHSQCWVLLGRVGPTRGSKSKSILECHVNWRWLSLEYSVIWLNRLIHFNHFSPSVIDKDCAQKTRYVCESWQTITVPNKRNAYRKIIPKENVIHSSMFMCQLAWVGQWLFRLKVESFWTMMRLPRGRMKEN